LALLKWWMNIFQGSLPWRLVAVGGAGGGAIVVSIIGGVWVSVWVGTGKQIHRYPSYTWWVVNRLLFMTGVVAVQSFALYFIQDVLHAKAPAQVTAQLMMAVGILTLISALISGRLATRFGRKPLLITAGLGAALGVGVLLLATNLTFVFVSGMLIGVSSGLFMSVSWALGTSLVPAKESGRFLGISNLAGAGAGAIGSGIGGPLADYFNQYQAGLGYLVMFAILLLCFLLSALVLRRVKVPEPN
jgi:MFS family permease